MEIEQDLTPLLDTQQNQLGITIAEGTSLDAKTLAVAATNVAILLFIAQSSLHPHQWWQYIALLGPFALSTILNGLGLLLPKSYYGSSIDLSRNPEYLQMDKETLTLHLLSDTRSAIRHNDRINSVYWRYWLASVALTLFGAVLVLSVIL